MNGFLGGLLVGALAGAAVLWFEYAAPLATKQEDAQAQLVEAQKAITTAQAAQRDAETKLATEIANEESTKEAAEKRIADAREASDRQIAGLREQMNVQAKEADALRVAANTPQVAAPVSKAAPATVKPPSSQISDEKAILDDLRSKLRDVLGMKATTTINTFSGISVTNYPKNWNTPELEGRIDRADASMYDARTLRDQINDILKTESHPF